MTVEVDLTYNKVDVTHKSRGCYKWVEITMQGFGDSTIYGVLLIFCFYSDIGEYFPLLHPYKLNHIQQSNETAT